MEVRDAPERQRFELRIDGELTGFIQYRSEDGTVVMTHAEVAPAFEGRGLGIAMVKAALDFVRESGRTVVPRCWFVAAYIDKHPEYADLLAARRGPDWPAPIT